MAHVYRGKPALVDPLEVNIEELNRDVPADIFRKEYFVRSSVSLVVTLDNSRKDGPSCNNLKMVNVYNCPTEIL